MLILFYENARLLNTCEILNECITQCSIENWTKRFVAKIMFLLLLMYVTAFCTFLSARCATSLCISYRAWWICRKFIVECQPFSLLAWHLYYVYKKVRISVHVCNTQYAWHPSDGPQWYATTATNDKIIELWYLILVVRKYFFNQINFDIRCQQSIRCIAQ